MQINEIPSPAFAVNEEGKVSVFLPELAGEARNPEISRLDEHTLLFKRTPDSACTVTAVPSEIIKRLSVAEKMLVVEVDLSKVVDLNDKKITDPAETFKRYYEVAIDTGSFSRDNVKK